MSLHNLQAVSLWTLYGVWNDYLRKSDLHRVIDTFQNAPFPYAVSTNVYRPGGVLTPVIAVRLRNKKAVANVESEFNEFSIPTEHFAKSVFTSANTN